MSKWGAIGTVVGAVVGAAATWYVGGIGGGLAGAVSGGVTGAGGATAGGVLSGAMVGASVGGALGTMAEGTPSMPQPAGTTPDNSYNAALAQANALMQRRGMASTMMTSPMGAGGGTSLKATLG